MKPKHFLFLTLAMLSFNSLMVYWADNNALPGLILQFKNLPYGDFVGHFVLMGTLAALTTLTTQARSFKVGRVKVLLGIAIILPLVLIEEFSQRYFIYRSFSYLDMVADVLGICLLSYLAKWGYQRLIQSQAEVNAIETKNTPS